MKLKDKKGETRLDKASIKRIYEGIEKRKVPLWGRIIAGVGIFTAFSVGTSLVLRPDKISDEPNGLDMLILVTAIGVTGTSTKFLRKLKTLKKGDLLYQE